MVNCNYVYTVDGLKTALEPVLKKHNVKKAVLFGSYVKGEADEKSDVDLLLDSGLRGFGFVELIEEIRIALNKDVDVFDVTHIEPDSLIHSEISKDGVVIYER